MEGIAPLLRTTFEQMKAAAAAGGLTASCLAPSRHIELVRGDSRQSYTAGHQRSAATRGAP